NVLLGDDGRIKVADFGLARAIEASTLTATTGLLIGTVAYLAPEQVEHGRADTRTDVYAAGILLFELLTGGPPYTSDSPMSVAYRHVHEDVPPPSTLVDGLPAALDDLVVRATRRDPAARPMDAGAFLAELRTARQDVAPARPHALTLVVPRDAVAPPAAQPPHRRRRLRRTAWVAALSVLLVAALAGGWYVGLGRYTSAPAVLGLSKVDAEAALQKAGLRVDYLPSAYSEDVAAQRIIDQDPRPNGRVRKGGTVMLLNSLGPDRRAVPSVIGSTRAVAAAALERIGLKVGAVTTQFDSRPVGIVVSSDPPSGERARPGAAVALVVSKGPDLLPVPDVTGKPVAEATATLNAAGFRAEPTEVFSDGVPAGRVVSQAPADGQAVRDSAVRLQVSKGPELITVPDLRGSTTPQATAALKALGLTGRAFDLPDGQGRVVTQSPRAGSRVRRGAVVTFYVL
ncbi:MAG: serine/threonine protein kinase, partial [Frankiales bacterium]|nr:serine/threonine protein kinase [Frankiales bacterium]